MEWALKWETEMLWRRTLKKEIVCRLEIGLEFEMDLQMRWVWTVVMELDFVVQA